MLSTEFHRYLMENEELAERIPANSVVIFQVNSDEEFNRWHKNLSMRNVEHGQSVLFVNVKKWRKHSSIEELSMADTL